MLLEDAGIISDKIIRTERSGFNKYNVHKLILVKDDQNESLTLHA